MGRQILNLHTPQTKTRSVGVSKECDQRMIGSASTVWRGGQGQEWANEQQVEKEC
jgi:hypothetical protein